MRRWPSTRWRSEESILASDGPAVDDEEQDEADRWERNVQTLENTERDPKSNNHKSKQKTRHRLLEKSDSKPLLTRLLSLRQSKGGKRSSSQKRARVSHEWYNNAVESCGSEASSVGRRSYSSSAAEADDEYESICTEDEIKDTRGLPENDKFDILRLKRLCDQYSLTPRHIRRLFQLFKRLDSDRSGTVDKAELFAWLDEPLNLFSRKLFELVDVPRKGHLDFVAFCKVLVTYALFGKDDILRYCFYAFDSNSNGCIDHNELHQLVSLLHGDEEQRFYNIELVLQKFDQNLDGVINFEEFQQINRQHPYVLYPAFRMQKRIEEKTFGSRCPLVPRMNLAWHT
ncbi:Calcium-dependent protein kinase 12 [Hondaea fermentalgiana]|uniref:Calcium-dependent protein kinase 12 n=1 Tax=Hondaea fermentalgiana TaxID=2315210 RepID=A0A2R5GBM9_9STRA|nr:Calcium-dependent protein kinase 12 [Hondaea fermentalgiana]|eukprot:GBG27749.1 Calcium-dependent protein kinase 12 [Hondaea fermentalgiana]